MQTYIRFKTSSVISTLLDSAMTIVLTEALSVVHYVFGGRTHLRRDREFYDPQELGVRDVRVQESDAAHSIYSVWIFNLFINTIILYVLTDLARPGYQNSNLMRAMTVGILINNNARKYHVLRV